MIKRWVLSIVICLLLMGFTGGAVIFILQFKKKAVKAKVTKPLPKVKVISIFPVPFDETLHSLGTLEPLKRSRVTSEISGYVTYRSPLLEPGKRVDRKTILVKVAPERVKLQKKIALESWEQAKLQEERLQEETRALAIFKRLYRENLNLSQQQVDETALLYKKMVTSKYDLDNAKLRVRRDLYNLAEIQYKIQLLPVKKKEITRQISLRKLQYQLAKRNEEFSQIRAPFPGTIVLRAVEVGQKAEMGKFFFEIIDDNLVAKVDFSARYLPFLRKDLPALLTCPAIKGSWKAYLDRIHPQIDPINRTVSVYLRIPKPSPLLRPGLFVRATISLGHHPQAMVIPRVALRERSSVLILKKGVIQRRFVKIRRYIGDKILIQSGLQKGDHLIISQGEGLVVGSKALAKLPPQKNRKIK